MWQPEVLAGSRAAPTPHYLAPTQKHNIAAGELLPDRLIFPKGVL